MKKVTWLLAVTLIAWSAVAQAQGVPLGILSGGGGGSTVSRSGAACTANALAKWSSALVIGCSVLSDDGTTLTSSIPYSGPAGTVGNPALRGGDADSGIYFPVTGQQFAVSVNNAARLLVQGGSVAMILAGGLSFGNNSISGDTTLFREAAGMLRQTPVTFADLGAQTNGTYAYCSDCTKATPCAGGGTGAWAVRLNGAWDCDA